MAATDFYSKGGEVQSDVWELTAAPSGYVRYWESSYR
jgi:hypothetical protein